MKGAMFGAAVVLWVAAGVFQMMAVYAAFVTWGLATVPAFLGTIFIGGVPIIGTIIGVIGAMRAWQWTAIQAVLLYAAPILIFFVAGGALAAREAARR